MAREAGSNGGLNAGNFGIVNGDRTLTHSYNANKSRYRNNGEPAVGVEPTKYITGEERELNFLDSVRPNTPRLISREEPFIAFTS